MIGIDKGLARSRVQRMIGGFVGAALAAAPAIAPAAMQFGVNTHFGQGWPTSLLPKVGSAGAVSIRDGIRWQQIEHVPGRYDFTPANVGYIAQTCSAGRTVLLGFDPRNPLYDGGQPIFSSRAQHAFALFVRAVADRFGPCIVGAEIGNEINGGKTFMGTPVADPRAAYVALLKDLYDTVKPGHPWFKILGGSTNAVAIGFLERLFDAGMLGYVDGIVVHPYRSEPANLDFELARLNAAMRARGVVRPIWATEFGDYFKKNEDAPPFLLKMVAEMSAAGVEGAYWYALIDEKKYPNMGLYLPSGGEKPAARAFAYAAKLLNRGPAARLQPDDPTLYLYRFGRDSYVVWGAPRSYAVSGPATYRDPEGHVIARPEAISEQPFVVEGATAMIPGKSPVIADSLSGYGRPPWSYFADADGGPGRRLGMVDWKWTSYIGVSGAQLPAITPIAATTIGSGGHSAGVTIRFTSVQSMPVVAAVCFGSGDRPSPAAIRISHNDTILYSGAVTPAMTQQRFNLQVQAGDKIDATIVSPPGPAARTRVRVRIMRTDAVSPPC